MNGLTERKPALRSPPFGGGGAPSSERIAKRLARAGIASRRDAEALIADGRVKVNGVEFCPRRHSTSAPPTRIELDGAEIPPIERTRLFLFHKPAGVVTTNRDPEGRRTVFDVLPKDLPRLMTVGRLDINTEGLLLLTNDGGLARVLELPATGWLRRYRVRVHGKVDETGARRAQGRHRGRRRLLRQHRGRARPRAGHQCLADDRSARGQEPRGQEHSRRARPRRDPADPRLLRPVPARRTRRRRRAGAEGPHAARPARRAADRGSPAPISRRRWRCRFRTSRCAARKTRGPSYAERPKIVRDGVQGRIGEGGLIKGRRRDRDGERTNGAVEADHATRRAIVRQEGARSLQARIRSRKARCQDDGFRKPARQSRTARLKGKPEDARSRRRPGPRMSGWRRAQGPRARRSGERRRAASPLRGQRARVSDGTAGNGRTGQGQGRCGSSAVSSAAGRWQRRAAMPSARPPTAPARRCSTSWRTGLPTGSTARACSICSPAPARSGWRRCRAARPSACSSKNRPRGAA